MICADYIWGSVWGNVALTWTSFTSTICKILLYIFLVIRQNELNRKAQMKVHRRATLSRKLHRSWQRQWTSKKTQHVLCLWYACKRCNSQIWQNVPEIHLITPVDRLVRGVRFCGIIVVWYNETANNLSRVIFFLEIVHIFFTTSNSAFISFLVRTNSFTTL